MSNPQMSGPRACQCEACRRDGLHLSGCANEPAYPAGPCNCGATDSRRLETPPKIGDTEMRCNVICVHGGLCRREHDHDGPHRTSGCEWEPTSHDYRPDDEELGEMVVDALADFLLGGREMAVVFARKGGWSDEEIAAGQEELSR